MGCNSCGTGIVTPKTLVIGSDDVICVDLKLLSSGKGLNLSQNFTPGGDTIACIQNSDGLTSSQFSWSATGGNFPSSVIPDAPDCGSFHINVTRYASSGWAPNDSADINLELRTPTGGKRILVLSGVIAIVSPTVAGLP
jgi:hypothetical protein